MPNRHLYIGLIAIVIIATAGGVSYAALGTKPETAQVQQIPSQTNTTVGSAAGTSNSSATTAPPSSPPTTNAAAPAASQTTPSTTGGSSSTSSGGSTTPSPSPTPKPTPTPTHTPSPTPSPSPAPSPTHTPPPPTYTYKNGSFSKTVSYSTPGGSESLGVTIAITNDIVSASSVTLSSTSGESGNYQTQFKNNYQPYVVGKALASLNLSRVSGASLTTNAFNTALGTIRTLAKN